jgi:hypothetical protein
MQFVDLLLIVCIACGWDNDFGYWVSISLLIFVVVGCVEFVVAGASPKMAFIVSGGICNKFINCVLE